MSERLALLDSARHKLRLADYHARALLNVLDLHPTEDEDDPRRVEMEAHLEGLAYTGTAAAEKTIRSVDPAGIDSRASVEQMIRSARHEGRDPDVQSFARRFDDWWQSRGGGSRRSQIARNLRNDAAHRVYEKGPEGPVWRMEISGSRVPIALTEFARDYCNELAALRELVEAAERLAREYSSDRDLAQT